MTATSLTSAEVVYALVHAKAVGKLTVSGDNPVVITGPDQDRGRARAVLAPQGWTCTLYPDRDEWTC